MYMGTGRTVHRDRMQVTHLAHRQTDRPWEPTVELELWEDKTDKCVL